MSKSQTRPPGLKYNLLNVNPLKSMLASTLNKFKFWIIQPIQDTGNL